MRKIVLALALCIFHLNVMAILPVAKISALKGKAKVDNQVASVGLEVAEGNKIDLKRGEKMTIEFQNGHKVSLQNASVVFDTLNPKNTLITLERGSMLVEIKSLTPNENFHIRSQTVIVSSNPAVFMIDNNGKRSKVAVESGSIQIQRLKEAMNLDALEQAIFDRSPRFEKNKVKSSQLKRAMKVFR